MKKTYPFLFFYWILNLNVFGQAFKINSKDVTLSTDKDFKWYKWDKAPEDLKTASRYVHTSKNPQTGKDEILFDVIKQRLSDCEIEIAAVDLDGDGICGLVISSVGNYCCGTAGCGFDLYDNGGILTIDLGTDHGPTPTKNGVIASTDRFFPLITNSRITVDESEIIRLFTYDKVKQKNTDHDYKTDNGYLPKITPPTAASKKLIFKRWKAIEMIGENHDNFKTMAGKGESVEIQFSKDNKCYIYKNKVLEKVLSFILAPGGRSLLLSESNTSETMSMQILSLTTTQLIAKSVIFVNNTVIFKAN